MPIHEMKGCPWCACKPSTVSVSADCWQTYCGNVDCVAEVSVMGLTSDESMRIWNGMAAGIQPEAEPIREAIASSAGARGSMPELIALADTLCEKVGAFGFYHWEGTAKEMFDAAKAYAEARKASNKDSAT